MGNDFSSYIENSDRIPKNICVIFVTGLFYGINLPEEIIEGIQTVYMGIWNKSIERVKYYNPNLVKFVPHKLMMYQGADAVNSAKSKQMFCRFHKLFCTHGWSLISSPTLTFECSLSSWFYCKESNSPLITIGGADNAFCAISLSGYDSFQFIDFPPQLEESITDCLNLNWHKGIQEKGVIEEMDNTWRIKLNGNPWSSLVSGESAFRARFLVLSLIRLMSHQNWKLVNSTAMKPDASDTLFFRNTPDEFNVICPDSMPEYYFMLALMGRNYFTILGGDESIKTLIANSCANHERKGIQPIYTKKDYPVVMLNSNIWSRRREKALETKRLMTLLFQDLASIGWIPTESIDCSRSVADLSSIVFVRIQPIRMMFFCLCPKKYSGISLVNAPSDVQNIVYETFMQYYSIEKDKITRGIYGIGTTIQFIGDPFKGQNKFGVLLFQQTLAAIISALRETDWDLIVSADTSNETKTRSTGPLTSEEYKYSIYGLWFSKVIP